MKFIVIAESDYLQYLGFENILTKIHGQKFSGIFWTSVVSWVRTLLVFIVTVALRIKFLFFFRKF